MRIPIFLSLFAFVSQTTFGYGLGGIAPSSRFGTVQQAIPLPDGSAFVFSDSYQPNGNGYTLIQKRLKDGSLDASYGTSGSVEIPSGGNNNDHFWGGIVHPDGSCTFLLRASLKKMSSIYQLLPKGTMDPAFGTAGALHIPVVQWPTGEKLLQLGDGSYLILRANQSTLEFIKVLPNGVLDANFGTTGSVTTPIAGLSSLDAHLQPDGKILVTGFHLTTGAQIARFNPDGSLDTTFGTSGIVHEPVMAGFHSFRLLVNSQGDILLGGALILAKNSGYVFRFSPSGTLDSSFGENGRIKHYAIYDMALLPDDSVFTSVGESMFGKLTGPDLQLDSTFGVGGFSQVLKKKLTPAHLAVQADGKLLIGAGSLLTARTLLARLTADGALDQQ